MKPNQTVFLALGIDPNPSLSNNFQEFQKSVSSHSEMIKNSLNQIEDKILKIQLAFFLSWGSQGIQLLEEFVFQHKNNFKIIVDGKFNDIGNSFQAYLNFVFVTLGVHGITINPFLGEKSIQLAYETCAKNVGPDGRVYVLAKTSENSKSKLSYIQENFHQIISACVQCREDVFMNDPSLQKIAGVVVAAHYEDYLTSKSCNQNELSILAPGLGAQGADWSMIQKCSWLKNEIVFPISRGIFDGGNRTVVEMQKSLIEVEGYFK